MGDQKLKKPDRTPDFAIEQWWFYWPEMVQWNNHTKCCFVIALIDGEICYSEDDMWEGYDGMTTEDNLNCADIVIEAYKSFHKEIEKSLLGEEDG